VAIFPGRWFGVRIIIIIIINNRFNADTIYISTMNSNKRIAATMYSLWI